MSKNCIKQKELQKRRERTEKEQKTERETKGVHQLKCTLRHTKYANSTIRPAWHVRPSAADFLEVFLICGV